MGAGGRAPRKQDRMVRRLDAESEPLSKENERGGPVFLAR